MERGVNYGKIIIPFKIEEVHPISNDIELCTSSQHWLDAITPPMEKNILKLASTIKSLLNKSDDPQFPSSSKFAALSPLGEIYRMAKRWRDNDYAYFVLEDINNEIKSILQNTPKNIEIEDENVILFMMVASLHYGGNWIYWQNKIKNGNIASTQLLNVLKIKYIRPRFRALFALQRYDKMLIENQLSETDILNDENLKTILNKYIYPKTFVDYLQCLADDDNVEYKEKAKKVLDEIKQYSGNTSEKTMVYTLPI